MKLNILRADPAGNITLFVLDEVEKSQRAAIAAKLMAMPTFQAEQVGFACPAAPDTDGRMEMMGGEFCGNATRAYGMYISRLLGGAREVRLQVSGCDHIVTVAVDPEQGTARAEMPTPRSVQTVEVDGHQGTLVDLAGIAHFVVEDVAPSEEFFRKAEPIFASIDDLDAYGVIFLSPADHHMTPLVMVVDTGTLVWEGSCGSGSVACAVAQSEALADGVFSRDYIQPAGVVCATVERRGGEVVAAAIGGSVALDESVKVEVI